MFDLFFTQRKVGPQNFIVSVFDGCKNFVDASKRPF